MNTVYLDHAATTPLREEVRVAMDGVLRSVYGNPSSAHGPGRRAAAVLADARARAAQALGAEPAEILFVRGGTESDNLAVLGRAAAARRAGRNPVVAHSAVEHSAVLESCRAVEAEGGRRIELPVRPDGSLPDDLLEAAMAEHPDVLSVMWVNNETGTVLPVPDVARRARAADVVVHTDAVQAVGKVPVRVDEVPVDLLTATGHKIQGPRGTGILFVRRGTPLEPVLHGGSQERGVRPGTEDVAGAVGMAEALALATAEQAVAARRWTTLRTGAEEKLLERIPGLGIHGAEGERAPHVISLGIPSIDQDLLLAALDMEGIACSGGSACHSGASGGASSSHVLRALHADATRDRAALRLSFGGGTTAADVDLAVETLVAVVRRLRRGDGESPSRPTTPAAAPRGSRSPDRSER
ncbi:MAG: cysteine desulfurase family protein [Gemmatimonadota bacterium]|jgi:cysteine desulfurase